MLSWFLKMAEMCACLLKHGGLCGFPQESVFCSDWEKFDAKGYYSKPNFFKTILALAIWRFWFLPDIFYSLLLKRWVFANSKSLALPALPQSKARGTSFPQPNANTHSLSQAPCSGCLSVKSWWTDKKVNWLSAETWVRIPGGGIYGFFVCVEPGSAKHGPGVKSLSCLFLYSLGAENGFYILNGWGAGKQGRRTISSLRKIIRNSNFSI